MIKKIDKAAAATLEIDVALAESDCSIISKATCTRNP